MNKLILQFLDRLSERFVALLAGLISSRIEGLHAASQAAQQSDLEDLAREYEAAGKTEIATDLRRRAAKLTSPNPAAEGLDLVRNVTGEPIGPAARQDHGRLGDGRGLLNLGELGSPGKPKRPRSSNAKKPVDTTKSVEAAGDLL